MTVCSGALTNVAVADIPFHILPHLRPVVGTAKQLKGFGSPWMARNGGIVVLLHQMQREGFVVRHIKPTSIGEAISFLGAFCQRDTSAVADSISQHPKDLRREQVCIIGFSEQAGKCHCFVSWG
jgi:hypothetical protein